MKYLIAALTTLIMLVRFNTLSKTIVSYKPDTSKVVIKYSSDTKPLVGDTIRVTFARSVPGGLKSVTVKRTKQIDSITFKTPRIVGALASYWSCSYFYRKTTRLAIKCIGWDTNFPATVDTTLTIVAMLIKPDSFVNDTAAWKAKGIYFKKDTVTTLVDSLGNPLGFTCPEGGSRCPQQQFCTFFRFTNGKIAMRTQDAAVCTTEYNKLPLSTRTLTTGQQAVADQR